MWTYTYTDELYHTGRKGMKWYQHIYTKMQEHHQAKKNAKLEQKQINKVRKESTSRRYIKSMSDQQLNDSITRLQKEKQYKDLVQGENVTKGKKAISEALLQSAKSSTQTIATAAMTHYGKQAIKKAIGEDEFNRMFNIQKDKNISSTIKDLKNGKTKFADIADQDIKNISGRLAQEELIRKQLGLK